MEKEEQGSLFEDKTFYIDVALIMPSVASMEGVEWVARSAVV